MNKQQLLNVFVPQDTDTYSAVSHKNVIDNVYEQLDKHNLVIQKEDYNTNSSGTQVIGYFDIIHPDSSTLGMRIAFRNSYDKSMSLAFVAGSQVWICENGMISGELQFVRKHTGSIVKELEEKTIKTIEQLDEHFRLMEKHSEAMKQIELSKIDTSKLFGKMFFIDKLVTPTQLNIISRELDNPTFSEFSDENLWSAYNHVTYALRSSHPTSYISQHQNFHHFIETNFSL